ncbi:MAG: ATP-grasp domain-containing protein [Bifidobacterium pullorum]
MPGHRQEARRIATERRQGLVGQARATGEHGWGVFGVELFVLDRRLCAVQRGLPRPHDTGMVTMTSASI